jgi:hypothetical protein
MLSVLLPGAVSRGAAGLLVRSSADQDKTTQLATVCSPVLDLPV